MIDITCPTTLFDVFSEGFGGLGVFSFDGFLVADCVAGVEAFGGVGFSTATGLTMELPVALGLEGSN
jgi:hypothetical protein